MTDTLKVLGQSAPSATTLTALYTVPGATQAVGSSITICNRVASATTYRISVAPAGAADTNSQYLFYDLPIQANDTYTWVLGISLGATDVVRVYAGNANLSFSLFGVEVT